MGQTRIETTTTPYECPVAGHTVNIHRTWRVMSDEYGAECGRAATCHVCDNKEHCIVATHGPVGTSYDWSKCAWLRVCKLRN